MPHVHVVLPVMRGRSRNGHLKILKCHLKICAVINTIEQGWCMRMWQNPERQAPVGLAPARAAHYPPEKEAEFHGRAWIPVRDPELLDVPGAQLLLIGAHAQLPSLFLCCTGSRILHACRLHRGQRCCSMQGGSQDTWGLKLR